MKVLIAGATGGIGSQALRHSLAHPHITKVVAFTRRSLSLEHPKLENILMKDFGKWGDHALTQHADAAGMIWYPCSTPFLGFVALTRDFPGALAHTAATKKSTLSTQSLSWRPWCRFWMPRIGTLPSDTCT